MTTDTAPDPLAELAPSEVTADEPTAARVAGLAGFLLFVLGVAAVVANQYGDRFISAPVGYLAAALGLLGMLYHAAQDGELETRRLYLGFGLVLLVAAVVAGFLPGPLFGDRGKWETGYHFLPWTPSLALLSLAFLLVPFRHETDPQVRSIGQTVLFIVGMVLAVGSLAFGVAMPQTLAGPGVLLALVGLGFLTGFLLQVDSSDGPGYLVGVLLGVVGGAAIAYAIGRSAFPGVLLEGPAAIRTAYQTLDYWKVAARGLTILICLGFSYWAWTWRTAPPWLRIGAAAAGVLFAGVFLLGAFTAPLAGKTPPPAFLVPAGLLMGGIGLLYVIVSVGVVSDSQLVVITRRELGSYFASPVAYVVLFIMAVVQFIGYWIFVGILSSPDAAGQPIPEPILSMYVPGNLIGPLAAMFLVPVMTMRMYSEEKRSGAMEVLLTAPVNETPIVLGKMIAVWLFYMLAWAPMGLYLIGLRTEGGQPFDFKPLLSLYVAVAVSGLAFVAVGGFVSSLTNSQVVAGMLTFGWMIVLFMLHWYQYFFSPSPFVKGALDAGSTASYWTLWSGALNGQLPVRDMLVQASLAVFFGYLTVKSLESRKWS